MRRVLGDIAMAFARAGRRPHRARLAVLGGRLAVWAVVLLVAPTLATPPAAAQNGSAWLDPEAPMPLESDGKVVLTVTMWRAGRVAYQTMDGACSVTYSRGGTPPDASCSGAKARASEDYTAQSGELVFITGGSQTITIPIADDDVSEGEEAFTLAAWEEANADPWIDRGDSVVVLIRDDELDTSEGDSAAPASRSSTNTTITRRQSSGSAAGVPDPKGGAASTVGRTAPTTAPQPPGEAEVALPDGELRAEPGVELKGEVVPQAAPNRRGGDGRDGSSAGLAIALGAAAVVLGTLAVTSRRRRWSAKQP